jgi:predicted metal-dependent peptidase
MTKKFIVSHEMMHLILNHISRSIENDDDNRLANIAQDIVINEMLVSDFKFERSMLNLEFDLCFIDTVFSGKQINELKIEYGKSYHYYYDLLVQLREKGENIEFNSMDQHEKLDSEITQEIVEAAFDSLPDEKKEELAEQGIGKLAGMRR